ncbi:lysoplasmalogenase [Micromonospora sp. NPDC050187]|uniref:lysoplasmalogenase n=1 Tax=Micromonospora sp. NPDC050187 TaxID=3364277 RepID=UPI0037B2A4C7
MRHHRLPLLVFAVLTTANLVAVATDHRLGVLLTKPLLIPALAAYLWWVAAAHGRRPDRLLLAALAFSTGGDIALLVDGTPAFLTGMSLFLGAHLCYITAFTRHGAARKLLRPPLVAIPLGYAVATTAALAWMWPGLTDAGLAVPVAGYAIALATMAATAAGHGPRVALGGALFLLSDLIIATGTADVGHLPGHGVWVMSTYCLGQALIVTGLVARLTPTGSPATR